MHFALAAKPLTNMDYWTANRILFFFRGALISFRGRLISFRAALVFLPRSL
jgi:hypothetical protein